jgi:outer membrane cobalamin receptor
VEDVLSLEGTIDLQAGGYIGTAFSLPSFYDMYWKGDAQSLGNPDLKPETSHGGSAWVSAQYREYSLKASRFINNVDELIQWQQVYLFGTVWKPFNLGRATISNWEIAARAKPLPWLQYSGSLTLTKSTDKELDKHLTYTPDTRWVNTLSLSRKNTSLDLTLDTTGKQWTTRDNLIAPLPAVTLLNTSLHRDFVLGRFKAAISLKLNNLFDKQYEVYAYVPQPGFNWLGGLSLVYEM